MSRSEAGQAAGDGSGGVRSGGARLPAICFYGDDLTGSTDALSNFARFGLSVRMVFDVASIARVAHEVDVIGVAGISRSLPTGKLEQELAPVFRAFAELRPELVQYKVCSTFDSSPEIGSIGRVCELSRELFGARVIPVLPAQPDLGRWTAFSNHFARGFDGEIHRLDRHPTMSNHPVTPMREADLRRLLSDQCRLPVRGLHLGDLAAYRRVAASHPGPLVLDTLTNADLRLLGPLIRAEAQPGPSFCVGSGGLSYALASTFAAPEAPSSAPSPAPASAPPAALGAAGPVLAVSGSCSPDTAAQIEAAEAAGWRSADLLALGSDRAGEAALEALRAGDSVVVYTARGAATSAGDLAGPALGALARRVLAGFPLRRLIVAGGDTSGTVMRAIGGDGLEYLGFVGRSCALCRLHADGQGIDGLQVVLKGGQLGGRDFFEQVRLGAG